MAVSATWLAVVTNVPCEPLTTSPRDALTSTQTTGCSCPVRIARGEGLSPEDREARDEISQKINRNNSSFLRCGNDKLKHL